MSDISFNNWYSMSDGALAKNIGNFVKHHRMEQNQSQDSLSKSAGISRSTLSLLERGETVTLATLIRVLRVLEQLHIMDSFWVTQTLSPLALAKLEKSKRRRVRVKRVETATSKFTTETSKKIPNATDGDFWLFIFYLLSAASQNGCLAGFLRQRRNLKKKWRLDPVWFRTDLQSYKCCKPSFWLNLLLVKYIQELHKG